MMRARHLVPVVLGALPIVAAVACYGATAMQVEVLTDFTCPERLQSAIYAGGDEAQPVGETAAEDCTSRDPTTSLLGDLVFAPPSASERTATVTVKVQLAVGAGVDAKRCKETPELCVFASRKFTYVEHETRRLPVRLYRDCLGKQCTEGYTCVAGGRCAKDSTSCQGGDCTLPDDTPFTPPPADAGSDAAPEPDGGVAPKCVAPDGSDILVQLPSAIPTLVTSSPTALYWAQTASDAWTIYRLDMATGTPVIDRTLASGVSLEAIAYGGGELWWVDSAIVDGGKAQSAHAASGGAYGSTDPQPAIAMVVVPPNPPNTVSRALVADGVNVRWFGPNQFGTLFVASAASQLAVDPTRLFMLDGNGSLTLAPFVSAKISSVSQAVTAIASDGNLVFAGFSGGKPASINLVLDGVLQQPPLADTVVTSASELALDPTHVYWIEPGGGAGDALYRAPRGMSPTQSNATTVLQAQSDRSIKHVVPDGAADGCIYYWSENNPVGGGFVAQSTLRIAPKP